MDQCSKYFVEEPQDYLLCSICLGVFEKPVLLHCCGQTLCHKCVLECQKCSSSATLPPFRFRDKCPMCRKQGNVTYTKNVALEDSIQCMRVSCMNNKDNKSNETESQRCSWVGKLSEWKAHTASDCCLKADFPCPFQGCGFEGRAEDVEAHASVCVMNQVNLLVGFNVPRIEACCGGGKQMSQHQTNSLKPHIKAIIEQELAGRKRRGHGLTCPRLFDEASVSFLIALAYASSKLILSYNLPSTTAANANFYRHLRSSAQGVIWHVKHCQKGTNNESNEPCRFPWCRELKRAYSIYQRQCKCGGASGKISGKGIRIPHDEQWLSTF